jgi:hypothetical protein
MAQCTDLRSLNLRSGVNYIKSLCIPGDMVNAGADAVIADCDFNPPLNSYLSSTCEVSINRGPGSNYQFSPCALPVDGVNYYQAPCIQGTRDLLGSDGTIVPCSDFKPSSIYYLSKLCYTANLYERGVDNLVLPCTAPTAFQTYVQIPCKTGSKTSLGHDSTLAPCSQFSVPSGKYVSTLCSTPVSDIPVAGTDYKYSPCQSYIDGVNFVSKPCDAGAYNYLGNSGEISICSTFSFPSGTSYVSTLCRSTNVYTAGTDYGYTSCGSSNHGLDIPPGSYVQTPCNVGNANLIGSPAVIKMCTTQAPPGTIISKECSKGTLLSAGSDTQFSASPTTAANGSPTSVSSITTVTPTTSGAFTSTNMVTTSIQQGTTRLVATTPANGVGTTKSSDSITTNPQSLSTTKAQIIVTTSKSDNQGNNI